MKPTADEIVRLPGPPVRTRLEWRLYESEGASCYFCRSIFHPAQGGQGREILQDRDLYACDHHEQQGRAVMDRVEVRNGCCRHFEEDDRDYGF